MSAATRFVAGVTVASGLAASHLRSRGRTAQRAERIAAMDPERDHQDIAFMLGAYEFGWDFETALALAFFRTFASPSISGLLADTGEFAARGRKRYDDTELLLAEIIEHGYDSARGRAAIRRINEMHGRFTIADTDMLYVLSTFVFEPIRWADRYGWRALTAGERQAMFAYWRELGPRLKVKGVPDTIGELEAFNRAYERERFRYAPSNVAVAEATLGVLLDRLPGPLRGLGRQAVVALLDAPVRRAFGYPDPPAGLEAAVTGALRARGWLLRSFVPEPRTAFLITARANPTYPDGYRVGELGTLPARPRTRTGSASPTAPG